MATYSGLVVVQTGGGGNQYQDKPGIGTENYAQENIVYIDTYNIQHSKRKLSKLSEYEKLFYFYQLSHLVPTQNPLAP